MNARSAPLTIDRLQAHFYSAEPLDARQCEHWTTALQDADGESIIAGLTRADEWLLIRRLPLALRWRLDSGDAAVIENWQRSMRVALEEATRHPDSRNVLRYPHRRAALADLIYRSALGETARQWAWQRMALLPRASLSASEALRHGLGALVAAPELIWPVLHTLTVGEAETASLTALLRALSAGDWQALLRASPITSAYLDPRHEDAAPPRTAEARDILLSASNATHALLNWAQSRPYFAVRHVDVLSVLAAALSWSAGASSAQQTGRRLQALRMHLPHSLPDMPAPLAPSPDSTPDPALAPVNPLADTNFSSAPAPDELPDLPALPQPDEWISTAWAGALFWLRRVPASGLLDWLATQEEDAAALPLLLRALGEALGVPSDDAALRALSGGELPPGAPSEAVRTAAEQQVARWDAWLGELAPDLPLPRIETVCRRGGRLRFEAGWIELHLPLNQVDTAIRRLGLDLDPGWLPWLGCVLRIIYDE